MDAGGLAQRAGAKGSGVKRELYDLDYWIRQSLMDTHSPAQTAANMQEALTLNAVELGYAQGLDGSWFIGKMVTPGGDAGVGRSRPR